MFEPPVEPSSSARLTRRQDPLVTRFREAVTGRHDSTPGVVVLDGIHLLRDAMRAGVPIEVVLASSAVMDHPSAEVSELLYDLAAHNVPVREVTTAVMAAASPVKTPTGIVALAAWSPTPLNEIWRTPAPLVLGLVDVQDPGNAGAAIRSADGLGASAVIMIGATAAPGSAKALRGAMGSAFRIPVAQGSLSECLQQARAAGVQIAATLSPDGRTVDVASADLTRPTLLLLGNEGAGLPPEAVDDADLRLSIAMTPGVNSFNVAVTAALLLYEARRQRSGS